MVGHFGLHDLVGGAGIAGEDEAFGEGGIGGMNEVEVDEVLLLGHTFMN